MRKKFNARKTTVNFLIALKRHSSNGFTGTDSRLTVRNDGPDIATNATVTDIVQPGFSYVVGSIAGGTSTNEIDPAGVGLKWMLGTVPVNTDVVLTFDVTVNAP